MNDTVLVVDDHALSRLLLRHLLEAHGYEVREADTPLAGWAALEASQQPGGRLPSVILLDVEMPGGGGESLLARIRSEPRTAGLGVVAVTACAMAGDRERLLRCGFDVYVSKPIDTRVIVDTVFALANRRRAARP